MSKVLSEDEIINIDKKLPYSFAKKNKILIRSITNNHAEVYYQGKLNAEIIAETRRFSGIPLKIKETSNDEFNKLLREIYEHSNATSTQIADDINDNNDLLSVVDDLPEPEDLLDSNNDAPIIKFINAIVAEGLKKNASDIHIEPYDNRLTVRYRID